MNVDFPFYQHTRNLQSVFHRGEMKGIAIVGREPGICSVIQQKFDASGMSILHSDHQYTLDSV